MAERLYCGDEFGQVAVREGTERRPLDQRLDLCAHSSERFAWGPSLSRSAQQLALALVADALRNDARALRLHEPFHRRVVTLLPERWTITRSRVLAYIDRIESEENMTSEETLRPRPAR